MDFSTPPDREAPADHPIEAIIRRRWSPRSYSDRPVTVAQINSLLEAARWSASCYNLQPWSFIICRKHDEIAAYDALLGCLSPNNQVWAGRAPVLMLAVATLVNANNGNPNPYAWYDVGAAVANMAVQAGPMGLQLHSMAGFDSAKARAAFRIGEGFDPVAAISVGFPGAPDVLADALKARETGPRVRRPVHEMAHFGEWRA